LTLYCRPQQNHFVFIGEERHAACTMQDADARLPGVLLHAANHHGAPPLGRAGPGRLPAGLRTTRC